jgi:hypothetical protein
MAHTFPEPKQYELDGRRQTIPKWSAEFGMPYTTVIRRMQKGMGLREALTKPKQRQPKLIRYRGKSLTLTAWARLKGIPRNTLKARLDRGWLLERALQTPSHDKPTRGRSTQPDLTGRTFGDITVLKPAPRAKNGKRYHCRCACGAKLIVYGSRLLGGQKGCRQSASCRTKMGKRQWNRRTSISRGARNAGVTTEYHAWLHLRTKVKRGEAEVHEPWLEDFWVWLGDVGEKPERSWIFARLDWDKPYDIENACWMSQSEARKNYWRKTASRMAS